jgi:hypothetical protein
VFEQETQAHHKTQTALWVKPFAPFAIQLFAKAGLVFPVSDAGRIVTVTVAVTDLTIGPMDNHFRTLTLGNRYCPFNCSALRWQDAR